MNRFESGFILAAIVFSLFYVRPGSLEANALLCGPFLFDILWLQILADPPINPFSFGFWVLGYYGLLGTIALARLYYISPELLIQLIVSVSLSDALQYFIGIHVGHTTMSQLTVWHPSPNKTFEGYFFGMVVSVFICVILFNHYNPIIWICMGVLGDLLVSACKRKLKIKDTSPLLGPHGGWIDRLDGIFMASIIHCLFFLPPPHFL